MRRFSFEMTAQTGWYASRLRLELCARSRRYARGRAHVESYGEFPVIVYEPEHPTDQDLSAGTPAKIARHGNFFDAAYAAILARPDWMRRFDKIHAQAARSLPKPLLDPLRCWRELDSSMSSDALLMNVFCTPGVVESAAVRNALGVEDDAAPVFGWKARVPLASGRFDRTEVDMQLGSLLVEAKLTETGFQTRAASVVEAYRDFDAVFVRELLPHIELSPKRRLKASEFPENLSQEFESLVAAPDSVSAIDPVFRAPGEPAYASYQLIRNVLAAYATGCSFCVLHDARRPDLREAWFQVMAAVKSAEMRTRLKVLTWQELAALLPAELQQFLDRKYGIVAPGNTSSPIDAEIDPDELQA
jgi:hypothetical protein